MRTFLITINVQGILKFLANFTDKKKKRHKHEREKCLGFVLLPFANYMISYIESLREHILKTIKINIGIQQFCVIIKSNQNQNQL